jgi:hypothetical protein
MKKSQADKKSSPAQKLSPFHEAQSDEIRFEILRLEHAKRVLKKKRKLEKELRLVNKQLIFPPNNTPSLEAIDRRITELKLKAEEAGIPCDVCEEEIESHDLASKRLSQINFPFRVTGPRPSLFDEEVWKLNTGQTLRKNQIAWELAGDDRFAQGYYDRAQKNEESITRSDIARQMQSRVAKALNKLKPRPLLKKNSTK